MNDNTNSQAQITGSCACGKVKFVARPPTQQTVHCYCTTCRKCSGSDYIAFTHFNIDQVHWTTSPQIWRKTDRATRGLCKTCGSCVSMMYDSDPRHIAITLGRLIGQSYQAGYLTTKRCLYPTMSWTKPSSFDTTKHSMGSTPRRGPGKGQLAKSKTNFQLLQQIFRVYAA